ncbi:phosphoglycerate dehydrogenase-like enzyme [Frondihabitans sp. PhB188]|uniref:D-2-hydroxyacid dehydrogenase family protein n=1 Tax=Frondihabitans sp. PhB188 TaxID=2485200 RepID=UPI000F46381D|nr:D-2-hydroxyacid dehydrogenase family protein [Frondihabitans sp. PhB188]ROQ39581.1 phosphoglycerate dehydrogenase-like enzyme [Frondihabitans sp. PhB188]
MPAILTILDDYQSIALDSADWSEVREHFEIDVVTEHIDDVDALVERLSGSQVVVAMRERTAFPSEVFERLPELRHFVTTGMANASVDIAAAKARGVVVTGTEGSGREVAELVIGMMIALARNIVAEDAALHADGWQHTIGTRLEGRTLGLLGLGKQARWVAELALAFRMRVVGWSPSLTPERAAAHGVAAVSREELFEGSDFLSVHVPLTEATRGIIGAEELATMKETAFLINTSRGPIVDSEALMMALMVDTLAGAALDVYDVEPLPLKDPLRKLSNVLLLPHIGYVTREVYDVFYGQAVENVLAVLSGTPVREL